MVTVEIVIGNPADSKLYSGTLKKYNQKMKVAPPYSITDQGYRSKANFKAAEHIDTAYFGKSCDVPVEKQKFCKSARSANEGFIAVAKNLRGFKRSLYRGIEGDKIWAALCQTAYNLRKFLLLYYDEKFKEKTLVKLGLLI